MIQKLLSMGLPLYLKAVSSCMNRSVLGLLDTSKMLSPAVKFCKGDKHLLMTMTGLQNPFKYLLVCCFFPPT